VVWLWVGLGLGVIFVLLTQYHFWILRTYAEPVKRIFQEKPLFVIPRGQPVEDAEAVRFPSADGLNLTGCYLRAQGPRLGVILFGLEFGSDRWACVPYCQLLRSNGFDIFSFECRNQGNSDHLAGYEPLQWVTEYEVRDFQGALAYLKSRPDADPRGVGLFGLSKGGSAGLVAAADDPFVRCFVTDGIFAAHTTMVPYMRQWVRLFSNKYLIQNLTPDWYYRWVASEALARIERERHCSYAHLEYAMPRLGERPILMIHGGGDTYIKPEMARSLFDLVKGPKEFWLVETAKHNQSLQVANGAYQQRVLAFFQTHLAPGSAPRSAPSAQEPAAANAWADQGTAATRT
jgi:pimeloyl-ACP methyl ester carboxylesterase